eukprot:scaffold274398_cov36-Tisochrysis_lutea.AAC.2
MESPTAPLDRACTNTSGSMSHTASRFSLGSAPIGSSAKKTSNSMRQRLSEMNHSGSYECREPAGAGKAK